MTLSRYASNTALLRPGTSAQPSTPAPVAIRRRPLPMASGVQVISLIFMAPTIPGCAPAFVVCSQTAMAVVVDRKTKLTYEYYPHFPEDGCRH